jgi:Flp pilus assembly protein TadD
MEKDIEKQINRADGLLNKNKPLEAVLVLKKTALEFPEYSYVHYLLGIARMKCGLFCLAIKSFEEAGRLFPNNPENLRSLGWTKIMLGEIEDGRSDLRDSINLNLTNARPYIDLAMSYFEHFDFKEGFAWLERARALDSKNKFILKEYKLAKEIENDFLKLSEADKELAIKRKTDSEQLKNRHLFILRENFRNREYNREEAIELKEEMDLSGLIEGAIKYKETFKSETKESICKKREKSEEYKRIKENFISLE